MHEHIEQEHLFNSTGILTWFTSSTVTTMLIVMLTFHGNTTLHLYSLCRFVRHVQPW